MKTKLIIAEINFLILYLSMISVLVFCLVYLSYDNYFELGLQYIFCIGMSGYFIFKITEILIGFVDRKPVSTEEDFNDYFGHDLLVVDTIRSNTFLLIPFFFSLVICSGIFYYLEANNVVDEFINNGFFNYILYYFSLFFTIIFIFTISFMAMGEILQRKYSKPTRPLIFDMFLDTIYAIPFVIILAVIGVIFLLVTDKKNESDTSILKKISVYGFFVWFKYFTYINLVKISYDDKHLFLSYKKSKAFFKEHSKELFSISISSSASLFTLVLSCFSLFVWNSKIEIISKETMAQLMFIVVSLFIYFQLLIEQISILFYYIGVKKNLEINKTTS